MRPMLLNLALALLWTFLSRSPSITTFAIGLVLGFGLIAAGQGLITSSSYVRRVLAFGRFLLVFLREFLGSNLALARVVLFRSRDSLNPGFLTYDVSGLTDLELRVLTHCVSLTPGTTSVDVIEGGRTLLLHALDAGDPAAVRRGIDLGLREPILRWTR